MKKYIRLLVLVGMLLRGGLSATAQQNYVVIDPSDSEKDIVAKAAKVTPTPGQLRWQQLELTAFFHFGINTFTNKEWGDGTEDERLFNPTALDARQWVSTCKKAGIKQVILTCKHHDGFCLWPSKYTRHCVRNSPWKGGKGDVVREVSNACKEMGVGFGVYLSPWDRNNKAYGTDTYNEYFVNQLTELLTNYGKVDEVWFDGANGEGPNGKKQVYDFPRWYKLIRKLQPKAVIAIMGPDVRWVGTESGYGREQEWSVIPFNASNIQLTAEKSQTSVDMKPTGDMTGDVLGSREKIVKATALGWYPAETDVSIRPGWFYHSNEDADVKTPEKLMDIYFNSVGRNSVLLLNIPPDRRGLLSDADVKSLMGWKAQRDRLFSVNLAGAARITRADRQAAGDEGRKEYILQYDLPKTSTFDVCSLQEDITKGQRVESFVLEGFQNGEWKKIAEGTTIGYKRLLKFDPYTTSKVRLRILSSRLEPYIGGMGLYETPPGPLPTARQLAWEDKEFYLFTHFGPNTFTDLEWGKGTEKEELFNPSHLDCRQWCRIAKAAGAKGIIITAKHHDGFCLWPTKYSSHTVAQSKWKDGKGDVLRELSNACREYGLGLGIYLSPWDRNHPKYGTQEYNEVFINMMKEVVARYGPLFEFWWDGANGEGPNGKKQIYDWHRFQQTMRTIAPNTPIFSDIGPDIRWVGNESGIAGTTNWDLQDTAGFSRGQGAPSTDTLNQGNINGHLWLPAECDVSIRPGWFYHQNEDTAVKTPEKLFDLYLKSVGRGANLLLNVPPDRRGLFAAPDSAALMGFKRLRDEAFHSPLLHQPGTKMIRGANGRSIDITFPRLIAINCIVLEERIEQGQRVKSFSIQVTHEDGSLYETGGTTIGHKRILTFPRQQARSVKITITDAKATPLIGEPGIYHIPEKLVEHP